MVNRAQQRTIAARLVMGVAMRTGRAEIASGAPVPGVVHQRDQADIFANKLPRMAAQSPQTGPPRANGRPSASSDFRVETPA